MLSDSISELSHRRMREPCCRATCRPPKCLLHLICKDRTCFCILALDHFGKGAATLKLHWVIVFACCQSMSDFGRLRQHTHTHTHMHTLISALVRSPPSQPVAVIGRPSTPLLPPCCCHWSTKHGLGCIAMSCLRKARARTRHRNCIASFFSSKYISSECRCLSFITGLYDKCCKPGSITSCAILVPPPAPALHAFCHFWMPFIGQG